MFAMLCFNDISRWGQNGNLENDQIRCTPFLKWKGLLASVLHFMVALWQNSILFSEVWFLAHINQNLHKPQYNIWHIQFDKETLHLCTVLVWRPACVRVRPSKPRGLSKLSRGFGSSPRRLPRHVPGPRSVISWTFLSRARPSPRHAPRLPLLLSILQRWFRSTAGAATLLYLLSSSSRRRGPHPQSVPVRSRLSVCLSDRPFPSRNPAFRCQWRVLSGLPASWSPLRTAKLFVRRWLVYWQWQVHSLTAHTLIRQLPVPFTLQQTVSSLSPIGRSGTSDSGGLRWSPHLLPILRTYA